jgi:hypothetical protein
MRLAISHANRKRLAVVAIGAIFGWLAERSLGTSLAETAKSLLGNLPGYGPLITVFIDRVVPAATQEMAAAPLIGAALGFFMAPFPPVRPLVNLVAPEPPPFLARDIGALIASDKVFVPPPRTGFLGREADMAALDALLAEPKVPFRWMVMTGASGIGKTRLALEWLRRRKGWHAGMLMAAADIPADWRPGRFAAVGGCARPVPSGPDGASAGRCRCGGGDCCTSRRTGGRRRGRPGSSRSGREIPADISWS